MDARLPDPGERALRDDLSRLVQRLLADPAGTGRPIGALIREHLGPDADRHRVLTEQLQAWELPNLQLAIEAALREPGRSARTLGVAGPGKRFTMLGVSDLLAGAMWTVGPPEYANAPVGPAATLACLDFAVLLVRLPAGPLCLLVRRDEHGHDPVLAVQAVAPDPDAAAELLAELRRRMDELDVYRGQVISLGMTPMGTRRIVFAERPEPDPSRVVLPEGVLERIERHVLGPTRHREALVAAGRHLARGLLLWGPPGSGKTHTVRHLMGLLTEATVIVLSGASLGMVGAFGPMARRLAPAAVVFEDVDLVARSAARAATPRRCCSSS